MIDKQGVRNKHLNNRSFTIALNGGIIDNRSFTPRATAIQDFYFNAEIDALYSPVKENVDFN